MTLKSCYTPLLRIHRWLALALAPFFLLILLSGAILACKPIVEGTRTPASVNVSAVQATLAAVDPQNQASQLALSADGTLLTVKSRAPAVNGSFDLQTHEPRRAAFDVFDFALRLHKSLLVGAGFIVEIATYVMVALIVIGLLLGWPTLRNTLMGWHAGLAWLALPLVLLTPVTALLMILHLGSPVAPPMARGPAVTLSSALATASRQQDLSHLSSARSLRGGAVLLQLATPTGTVTELVPRSGAIVAGGNSWVRMLHEGNWAGVWSGLINLASALILSALTLTGVLSWWRRHRQSARRSAVSGTPGETTLIAYASQTGTAARLAEATAAAVRAGGQPAMLASLSALSPGELPAFRSILLLVSTTGHGELPETARGFVRKLADTSLRGTAFSMLALGDTRYDHYCGGGLALRDVLLRQGAQERLPVHTLDNGNPGGWQGWLTALGLKPDPDASVAVTQNTLELKLVERTRLDDPLQTELNETWHLGFSCADEAVSFLPGDLLLVSPTPGARMRCYSIGSSSRVQPSRIELTVALRRTLAADGSEALGAASSWLCRLPLGSRIDAQLRHHPDFNPPLDRTRPLILVAAGAGLAPFPGFIAERRGMADAGPLWLLFGNRKRTGDFFYRQPLEQAQRDGCLHRLDTAFSRDADDGRYVTECLREQGAEVMRWMEELGALIYVCGGASTLGTGVETALLDSIAAHPVAGETATQTLERWKAQGRVKLDLFG
jgi:sulfite reductase (NADPH) flavoprotein alpha-component